MRAATYEKLGPARDVLKVGDAPKPAPQAGEVLVRVHASGVNPSDVKMRLGTSSATNEFPSIIPHSDGAGVIEAVGTGVPGARIGERVWLWNARWKRAFGTAAEYVALPAVQAVQLPDNTDFAAGACLGIPALTAWQAVETDGGVAPTSMGDHWVLVQGGAGSVGHYAVQMAKLKGARVIATVSSDAKAARAKAAGADAVVNYKNEDLVQRVKELTGGKGVDRVIEVDLAANIAKLPALVADYGMIVVYGSGARDVPVSFGASILGNIGYRFFIVYNQPPELRCRGSNEINAWLGQGKLIHSIAARYPLSEIVAAHEAVESGKIDGQVVVMLRLMREAELLQRLLYRDGLCLIIDKPAGLPVHAGPGGGPNLEQYLDALRFGLPHAPTLAHRLDRDTSGCLVLGRHRKALSRLGKLFQSGGVEKTYWAVTAGVPAEAEGVIDQPLKKITNRTGGWKMVIDPEGQASLTEYRVLGTGDGPAGQKLAWIECHPKTGRTHQIRVHLAALGAPLLGDPQYGDKTPGERPLHLLSRAISFKLYPAKPPVSAEAPVPPHMRAALKACGWRDGA